MASKSDLWAQSKGFKNYYQYRNYLAQMLGYKNYNQQRKARKLLKTTGSSDSLTENDFLRVAGQTWRKGKSAINLPSEGSKSVAAVQGVASGFDAADLATNKHGHLRSIPGTSQWRLAEDFDKVREGLFPRKKYDGNYLKAKDAFDQHRPRLSREITQLFGDPKSETNFVRQAWKVGQGDAAGNFIDEKYIQDLSYQTQDRLTGALDGAGRSSKFWDKRANKVTNAKGAKRQAGKEITGARGGNGAYRLDTYERMILNNARSLAYQRGLLENLKQKNQTLVRVSDGLACGWESHNDPLLANGMIVSIKDAMSNPLAHPNCVREFHPIKPTDKNKKKAAQDAKAIKANTDARLKAAAAKAAKATAVAGAIAGVATTDLNIGNYQGTIGNYIMNRVAVPVQRTLYGLLMMQNRMVDTLQRRPKDKSYTFQLRAASKELVAKQPSLSEDEAFSLLAEQVHVQSELFAAGETNESLGIFARRMMGLSETATVSQIAVGAEDFDEYYNRLRFFNKVPTGMEGDVIATLAKLNDSQNFFANEFARLLKPVHGKFAKLTFPRLSTLAGEARGTNRYARLSLNPNDLVHAHVSARPLQDGRLRRALNVKMNPNGMLRFGFAKNEAGALTPNIALVPPGPLRIYSRFNRAKPTLTKTIRGVTREYPNSRAGFLNSVTTNIEVKTGITFLPSIGYKFRVNMRALGIKYPQDILKVNNTQIRRWLQDNDLHKMVSATTDLRLQGLGFFDVKRTLTMTENKFWRWRAYGNTDINMKFLADYWRTEIMRLLDTDIDQGFYETIGRMLEPMHRLKDIDPWAHRDKVREARRTMGHYFDEIPKPAKEEGLYGIARYLWHLSERQAAIRIDALVDYLILNRRTDLPGVEGGNRTIRRLADTKKGYITVLDTNGMGDLEIEDMLITRPKLITAFFEADAKDIALSVGKKVSVDAVQAVKDRLATVAELALDKHLNLLPRAKQQEVLRDLKDPKGRRQGLRTDINRPELETRQGTYRFMKQGKLDPEDLEAQGLMPGQIINADDLGKPRVYGTIEGSVDDLPTDGWRYYHQDYAPGTGTPIGDGYDVPGVNDLTEYVIDGEAVHLAKGDDLLLTGDYQVVGVYSVRQYMENWDYPKEIFDNLTGRTPFEVRVDAVAKGQIPQNPRVSEVTRVYLQQVRSPLGRNRNPPDLSDLAVSMNEMPIVSPEDHLARAEILRHAYPDISDAARRTWDERLLRRIEDRRVVPDPLPTPGEKDADGFRFVGYHMSQDRDFTYDPDRKGTFLGDPAPGQPEDDTLFPLFATRTSWGLDSWGRYGEGGRPYAHEVWVLDDITSYDWNDEIPIPRGVEVRIKGVHESAGLSRRIDSDGIPTDIEMPFPMSTDDEGYVFLGWHSTNNPDWEFDSDVKPYHFNAMLTGEAEPELAPKLFVSPAPGLWREYVHDGAPEAWSHEVWVKGPFLEQLRAGGNDEFIMDIDEFILDGRNQIKIGQRVTFEEADEWTDYLTTLVQDRDDVDDFGTLNRLGREIFEKIGIREALDESAIARILRTGEGQGLTVGESASELELDSAKFKRLLALIDSAPLSKNVMSKEVHMSTSRLDRMIAKGDDFTEYFGVWDADLPHFTRMTGNQERVVLVARESRAVNISPLVPRLNSRQSYIVSGKFRITSTKEVVTPDGETITFVYVKYVEPTWRS